MRDGVKAEDTADFCRQELLDLYVDGFLSHCTEVGPCQDEKLVERAAQFLLKEPELSETFTVFPFRLTVSEGCRGSSETCWTFLQSFIKATELLETLCVYLVLQPWKKEIKTLKTFTGPFVYCLQPVFSSSNLQSVLASIGYLSHTASEYRLSEDVNPDRSMVVGFELLLARVECHRLLGLHDRDQMGRQEWLEILHRRLSLEETTDRMVTVERKMEEKKEEEDVQEVSLHLNSSLGMNPLPKPRLRHINSEDQSIMEMQMNYPDLAFRGRPLLPDKPQRANSWSSNLLHTSSYSDATDQGETADVPKRHSVKSTRNTSRTKNRVGRKADDVFVTNNKCSVNSDRDSGQAAAPGDGISGSICVADGGRDDDQHSRYPAISMRAGPPGEQSVDPEEPQLAAEASAWTQQTAADPPSLSSKDRTQDVVEHEETSDQPFVQMTRDMRRKQSDMKGEEKSKKERRRKERKASRDGQADEQNLTKPAMETGPPSYAAKGRTRFSKPDPLVMKAPCPPSLLDVGTTDPQKTHDDGEGHREETDRAEPGRGEEEQLAQSFVIL